MTQASENSVLSSAELEFLNNQQIGMIGFGAQGSAEAKNLIKSGLSFHLGLREKGPSAEKAQQAGVPFQGIQETVQKSDWLFINLSDESQAEVYQEAIRGSKVSHLIFAHGFNTHFEFIPVEETGPAHVLIAPKGAASGLESLYGKSQALPGILSFRSAQRSKPQPEEKKTIELLARAIGIHPKGLVWADFKDETVCDLFSEQALLCGGVSSLLRRAFEVLVEAGYDERTAYFETLYELKLIVDLLWTSGISGMRSKISPTARYGDITRGDRVIGEGVKQKMKEVLKEIESGQFADEFLKNLRSEDYKATARKQSEHPLERIGTKIRDTLTSSSS